MKSSPMLLAALALMLGLGWLLTRPDSDADKSTRSGNPASSPTKPKAARDAAGDTAGAPPPPITKAGVRNSEKKSKQSGDEKLLGNLAEILQNRSPGLDGADKAYIASLTQKLNLTPEQSKSIQALLDEREKKNNDMLASLLTGGKFDPGALLGIDEEAEEESKADGISALLDVEQKKLYSEVLAQENENRIEVKTHAEMARLQKVAPHLTDEQKNQAFLALSEDIRRRSESPNDKTAPALHGKVLENILTPEQVEAYNSIPSDSGGLVPTRVIRIQDSALVPGNEGEK